MADKTVVHEYEKEKNKFSALARCKLYAEELDVKLGRLIPETACIGFHLRQVFDRTAPSVDLSVRPQTKFAEAEKIIEENREYGLQTLNHVLDTLYYRRNGDETGQQKKLCIRVNYLHDMASGETCHTFDKKDEFYEQGDAEYKWGHAHYSVKKESFDNNDLKNIGDFTSGRFANVSKGYRCDEESVRQSRGNATKFLFNDFTCGAEKLCSDLQIDHSLSAYRVITAAIYQLGRYACKDDGSNRFGPQTVTLLIRPADPFSVVVGVTIIASTITDDTIKVAKKFLEDKSVLLNTGDPCNFEALYGDFEAAKELWQIGMGKEVSDHQNSIAMRLHKQMLASTQQDDWRSSLAGVLNAFLYTTRSFCGERLEGRQICFGFILGNPGLLTHTPREHPIPLEYVEFSNGQNSKLKYKLFSLTELMEQVHLVSMPSERAVVIPYYQINNGNQNNNPCLLAYLLEFDEAMEEFRARPWASLWREQFIPYLYYTERFPWAVATYAGPGADFRVFANGELVAYHGEKGWHEINCENFVMHLKNKANMDPHVARGIVDVSLQMSRFANPNAKGGMLVYLAAKRDTEEAELERYFSPLTVNEPMRVNGKPWLTGGSLIRKIDSNSELELNFAVAHTLLQAALLDGAIVLRERKDDPGDLSVQVAKFSQRIIVAGDGHTKDGPASGTKRAAAKALMAEQAIPLGSVAIAVSSDGPIRVWIRSDDVSGKPIKESSPFAIGELIRK